MIVFIIIPNVKVTESVELPINYINQDRQEWCVYATTASIIDYYDVDPALELCDLVALSADGRFPSNSPHTCCGSNIHPDCSVTGNIGNAQLSGTMADILNNHYDRPCYDSGPLNGNQIDSDIKLGMPILATWWFPSRGTGHAVLITGRAGNPNDDSTAGIYYINPSFGHTYELQSSFTSSTYKTWSGSLRMSSTGTYSIFNKKPTVDLMVNNNHGPVVEILPDNPMTITIVDRGNDWPTGHDIWVTCLMNGNVYYITPQGLLTTVPTRYDVSVGPGTVTMNVYSENAVSSGGRLFTVYKDNMDGSLDTGNAVKDMIEVYVPNKPPYINIGSTPSNGTNNEVEFCGVENGQGRHAKAVCTGYWEVNPCAWTSYCSTGWVYNPAYFYGCNPDCYIPPQYINIGCTYSIGINKEVEFCGIENGVYTHGKAICTGAWWIKPAFWESECGTGWVFDPADFYPGCSCN